jgi:MSHA biogenesis protein MshI
VRWLKRASKQAGWMVVGLGEAALGVVHAEVGRSGKPHLHQYAVRAVDEEAAGLKRASHDIGLGRYECATLLAPGEYQIVVVDAPNVPRDELKTAIRWRIKDLLDFHVDDVTIDVLDIPVPKDAPARNHTMYAVAARNDVLQARIKSFEEAAIPLSVIDIPETAQRNIAALYEESPPRAVAALHFDPLGGLLTINFQTELYLTRRLDIPFEEVASTDERMREETRTRVLLELQRSLDHFERQFRSIPIARLLLGPEPTETGLAEYLAANLGFPVQRIDLNDVLTVDGGRIEPPLQWQLFHLIGASLRQEVKAL